MATLRDNPVSNFILGSSQAGPPGVGGVRDSSHPLQQDPISGLWYDPQTGTSYYDDQGTQVVKDPNVAQQVATNFQRAQAFLGTLGKFQGAQFDVLGQQGDLAKNFRDVIAGHTKSLAEMQLSGGLNQIGAQQLSQAAGVSGAAAPLAQLLAMRTTGSASIGANNAAAQIRAREEADARTGLAQLLASEGQIAGTGAEQNIGGGEYFANLASTGADALSRAAADAEKARAASAEKLGYSLSGGAGAGLGSSVTGSKDKNSQTGEDDSGAEGDNSGKVVSAFL